MLATKWDSDWRCWILKGGWILVSLCRWHKGDDAKSLKQRNSSFNNFQNLLYQIPSRQGSFFPTSPPSNRGCSLEHSLDLEYVSTSSCARLHARACQAHFPSLSATELHPDLCAAEAMLTLHYSRFEAQKCFLRFLVPLCRSWHAVCWGGTCF